MGYADIIKARNPISYWRLGEASGIVAVDEMGVVDGEYTNSPTLGVAGAPLVDDGNTAMLAQEGNPGGGGLRRAMQVPHHVSQVSHTELVIEAWVKLHGPVFLGWPIVSKWGSGGIQGWWYEVGFHDPDVSSCPVKRCLQLKIVTLQHGFRADSYVTGVTNFPLDTWLYVVAVFKNSVFYGYVNNILECQVSTAFPQINDNTTSNTIGIGRSRAATQATVDEVALYDHDFYTANPGYPTARRKQRLISIF